MHIPPPFYFAVAFTAGLFLHRRWPMPLLPDNTYALSLAGYGLIGSALLLGGWAIATFWRHRTPVIPGRPARAMVTAGPFRLTRNPMYVGLFLLYTGLSLRLDSIWPFLFVPFLFALLNFIIIPGEERHLRQTFEQEFDDFCQRVRRWI